MLEAEYKNRNISVTNQEVTLMGGEGEEGHFDGERNVNYTPWIVSLSVLEKAVITLN